MRKMAIRALVAVILLALVGGSAFADEERVFPVPSEMDGAKMSGLETMDDGTVCVLYENATDSSLAYMIRLLNFYGYGVSQSSEDDGAEIRLAMNILTGVFLVIRYDADASEIKIFTTDQDTQQADDEEIQTVIDYYTQSINLPSGAGAYVFPQFYASTGRLSASFTSYVDSADFFPGTEVCWREEYSDLTPDEIANYISDMVLCGFDVGFDYIADDDDFVMIFPFTAGDAELILVYDVDLSEGYLLYKPGISYYLLSGVEYEATIPSK